MDSKVVYKLLFLNLQENWRQIFQNIIKFPKNLQNWRPTSLDLEQKNTFN